MTYSGPAQAAARSLEFSSSSALDAPAARHMAPPRRLLAAIALVALIGAGCSNAPAATGSGGGEKPATQGSPNPALKEKLLELAKCMRENSVKDFPDPGADGSIQYSGDSPEFRSAQAKCRDILPVDGNG
jgi:hypothetical protein